MVENKQYKLTKENNDTIGFVVTCLFCSSITIEELNKWSETIVKEMNLDDIPDYIFDLVDFKDRLCKIYDVIGFVPDWNHSKEDEFALFGISIKRGVDLFEIPITSQKALQCLEKKTSIEKRFCKTFDFIHLE